MLYKHGVFANKDRNVFLCVINYIMVHQLFNSAIMKYLEMSFTSDTSVYTSESSFILIDNITLIWQIITANGNDLPICLNKLSLSFMLSTSQL